MTDKGVTIFMCNPDESDQPGVHREPHAQGFELKCAACVDGLIRKLRYQGQQYRNGRFARGGNDEPHYLEDAADCVGFYRKLYQDGLTCIAALEKDLAAARALLKESQESIGGDWRARRDALLDAQRERRSDNRYF